MTQDKLSTAFESYSQHKIASWDLAKLTNKKVKDYSGNGHDLFFIIAYTLLRQMKFLILGSPVIHTNESFTVTARVCLT